MVSPPLYYFFLFFFFIFFIFSAKHVEQVNNANRTKADLSFYCKESGRAILGSKEIYASSNKPKIAYTVAPFRCYPILLLWKIDPFGHQSRQTFCMARIEEDMLSLLRSAGQPLAEKKGVFISFADWRESDDVCAPPLLPHHYVYKPITE